MDISLKHFLKTGELGDLRLEMPVEEVRRLLGPPDATGNTSHKYPNPSIYAYGSVELFFTQEPPIFMYSIWWYTRLGDFRLTSRDIVLDWTLSPGMRRAEVEDDLKDKSLLFECPGKSSSAIATTLVLHSGVTLVFEEDDVLYAVYAS